MLKSQLNELNTNGFVLLPQKVSLKTIEAARLAYQRMLAKVENKAYPFYRVYDDYLRFNVAGIEHIFHPDIYEKDLFKAAVESHVLQDSCEAIGTKKPVMLLNRIHCTTHYSHTGIWHRDGNPLEKETTIQVAVYLYDENRLWVIPGSHLRPNTPEENRLIKESIKADLPGQITAGGKAGDVLLFKSSILHRASSIGKRAHIHFRFGDETHPTKVVEGTKEWIHRPEVLDVCDNEWRAMFNSMQDAENNEKSTRTHRGPFKRRIKATLLHHTAFFLPESSPFFQKRLWVGTNLKLRQKILGAP